MFRTRLWATPDTEVEEAMQLLRKQCSSNIAGPELERVLASTRLVLQELIQRGRELSSIGSTMSVTRKIAGENYEIQLLFNVGIKKGPLAKLIDFMRGN
jgi:hypothetical protein